MESAATEEATAAASVGLSPIDNLLPPITAHTFSDRESRDRRASARVNLLRVEQFLMIVGVNVANWSTSTFKRLQKFSFILSTSDRKFFEWANKIVSKGVEALVQNDTKLLTSASPSLVFSDASAGSRAVVVVWSGTVEDEVSSGTG